MKDFRQTFNHVTQFKLEIGLPHPTTPNLVRNPNGTLGAWGWLTFIPNTVLEGLPPGTYGGTSYPNGTLKFTSPAGTVGGTAMEFYSETYPVTAGQWVGGRASGRTIDGFSTFNTQVEFLNAGGAVIATSAGATPITVGMRPATTTQAPAGSASVRLKVNLQRASTGARNFYIGSACLIRGTSQTTVANAVVGTFIEYVDSWVNVIGPTHSIDVQRTELDVGTLTARILDATIDPAIADTIRPGRVVVLSVANGFVWEPLFTGTVVDAAVKYDLERALRGDNHHAQITLAAVDNVATIAQRRMPYGVGPIDHLRSVLEGAGVPWNVNGNINQLAAVIPAVSINENATILDQVVITRDSNEGYAWVNRSGVLNVWDQPTLDAIIVFGKTNLISNASFETNTTGWTAVSGSLVRAFTAAPFGACALRYTSTAAAGPLTNYTYSPAAAVTPGVTYTASASVRMGAQVSDHRIMLRFYDGGGIPIAPDSYVTVPSAQLSGFTRMWVTGTAPAGAVSARVFIFAASALSVGNTFDVDGVMLTEGDEALAFFEGTVQQSFSERQYSDIDLAFSTKALINEVNVKSIEWDPVDPSKSIEVMYGPYRDEKSVQEWGPVSRTFTVNGLNATAIANLALDVLIRNNTPAVSALSIRVPILTERDINQRALLDLYNIVAVGYEPKRFNAVLRIIGIAHQITERGWVMDLELGPATGVALPQMTPAVG